TEANSGRPIKPSLVSGRLTLLADVAPGAGCVPTGNCTGLPPDPLPDVNAIFELGDATGTRGGALTVPFRIRADSPVEGYSFSVDFDEDILEGLAVKNVHRRAPPDFEQFDINNRNFNHSGVDEGFLVGEVLLPTTDYCDFLPANESTEVLRFDFRVK